MVRGDEVHLLGTIRFYPSIEEVAMTVNVFVLNEAEVQESLEQMAHAITIQAKAMTYKVNRQNVLRESLPVYSMADRLRDIPTMNPPILTGSKTSEDS